MAKNNSYYDHTGFHDSLICHYFRYAKRALWVPGNKSAIICGKAKPTIKYSVQSSRHFSSSGKHPSSFKSYAQASTFGILVLRNARNLMVSNIFFDQLLLPS